MGGIGVKVRGAEGRNMRRADIDDYKQLRMMPGRMLVRRLPPEDTFVEGGAIEVPDEYKKKNTQRANRGIAVAFGEPLYLAHRRRIDMKKWPVKEGDQIFFSSHGEGGEIDAGFNCKDGYEYVLVMYHEILAVV